MVQLGQEIDDDDLIPGRENMHYETQVAFSIYDYLPERWEGMNGIYLGKDYTLVPYLFNLHKLDEAEQKYMLLIMKYIDSAVAAEIHKKQKAASKRK